MLEESCQYCHYSLDTALFQLFSTDDCFSLIQLWTRPILFLSSSTARNYLLHDSGIRAKVSIESNVAELEHRSIVERLLYVPACDSSPLTHVTDTTD